MSTKRPDKIKLNVVKPPTGLLFQEVIRGTGSIYVGKLQEALNSDSAVEIMASDKYLLTQLKSAARKANLKLVFATLADRLYVKPVTASEQEKRLILLLREPRTMNELRAAKLELDLQSSLAQMARNGTAHFFKEKWVLTAKGMDLIG